MTMAPEPTLLERHRKVRPDWQWRLTRLGTGPVRWQHYVMVLFVLVAAAYVGYIAGFHGTIMTRPVILFGFGVIAIFVLQHPYVGIGLIVASIPLTEMLPRVPVVDSAFTALGALTLLSYLVKKLYDQTDDRRYYVHLTLISAAVFIGWFVVIDPMQAVFSSQRNWLLTFVQLWVMAWLVSQVLRQPRQHHIVMLIFVGALLVSSVDLMSEAATLAVDNDYRPDGLFGSSNEAARNLVIGIVMLFYLREVIRSRTFQVAALGAIGLLVLASIATLSRSGLALLVVALGLIFLKHLFNRAASRQRQLQFAVGMIAVALTIWLVPDNIFRLMEERIYPTITPGQERIEARFFLWQAALDMWVEHPITGIGMGGYGENLQEYLPPGAGLRDDLTFNAHSIYLQLLAETGVIGLALFLITLGFALRAVMRSIRSGDPQIASLAWAWLAVLLLTIAGGLTKQETYDKILWIAMGAAISFDIGRMRQAHRTAVTDAPPPAVTLTAPSAGD